MPSWWWPARWSWSRTKRRHKPAPAAASAACSPRHSDYDVSAFAWVVQRGGAERPGPSLDSPRPAARRGSSASAAATPCRCGGGAGTTEGAAVVVAGQKGFPLPRPKSGPLPSAPSPSHHAAVAAGGGCASPCTSVSGGSSSESDDAVVDHNRYTDNTAIYPGAKTLAPPDTRTRIAYRPGPPTAVTDNGPLLDPVPQAVATARQGIPVPGTPDEQITTEDKPPLQLLSCSDEHQIRFLDRLPIADDASTAANLQSCFVGGASPTGPGPRGRMSHVEARDARTRTRSLSPRPSSRGLHGCASPGGDPAGAGPWSAAVKRMDDRLKSRSQPLPLPPVPSTSSSRFLVPSSPNSSAQPHQSQWKKGKLLGSGTFGQVYLGFNSESGKLCAIKEVQVILDDSKSKEQLRQLNQEIDVLRQLSHQNIVQYYGSELTDKTLSIYLEYVSGGSIHNLIRDYGPFTEPVICNYTRQILCGLAYLHGRNTVHRDIKGANILVCPSGEVKLADFGVAKHITSFVEIKSFRGSPYWMAPEVIRNTNGYSLEVDIWSLGCTIIEMATGRHPWHQYTDVPAMFKIAYSKDLPEIPESFSKEGKEFLSLCLKRDPSQRASASQLLSHPFLQDHQAIRGTKSNITQQRNGLPFPVEACQKKSSRGSSKKRSIPPLDIKGQSARDFTGFCTAHPSSSDKASSSRFDTRKNMSLPVSPCAKTSSRQLKPSNWSCHPSPSHPAVSSSAGSATACNPVGIGYMQNQITRSTAVLDPWHDIDRPYVPQSPYGSPKRF